MLRRGLEAMTNFKEHYLGEGEAEVEATPRVGVPHLSHEKYPMDPKMFLDIIDFLKQNKGKFSPNNVNVAEKSDGMGFRIGMSEDDKFFIESSRSGPVFRPGHFRDFAIKKNGETNKISEGYEDLFNKLSVYKPLLEILKRHNKNGIKIVCEAFYLPTATKGPDNTVKFISTLYKAEKIGAWASFILFDALDGKGKSLPNKDEIIDEIKKISTKNIHFDDNRIPDWKEIDVSQEVKEVTAFIKDIESEEGKKIDEILSNTARDRNSMQAKSKLKAEIGVFQKKLHDKLKNIIKSGKWGDEYEGAIMNLANGIVFKIVSDRYKADKAEFNASKKK